MEDLDKILSGHGEAVSDDSSTQTENVAQVETDNEQSLDVEDNGTEADEPEGQQAGKQKLVPHEALHAEKQKVKRYTEEVVDLRKSNEALQRQVAEVLQRIPVPKVEPQAKPDWFENPDAAAQHTMQQTVAPQIDHISQQLMAQSQLIAGIKYGDDKVAEAEKAFVSAVQNKSLDPSDYQKVVNSPNRYAAAVQWYQRKSALDEIGEDPAAFKAKLEAEILAKHGITPEGIEPAQQQQAKPAVMPSNLAGARNVGSRGGPAWSGPPTLDDIFNRSTA